MKITFNLSPPFDKEESEIFRLMKPIVIDWEWTFLPSIGSFIDLDDFVDIDKMTNEEGYLICKYCWCVSSFSFSKDGPDELVISIILDGQ